MSFAPDAAFNYLKRAHTRERLAHAYLISGAPGSGKRELASRIAKFVNGDLLVTEPSSKSRRIVIEQIRNLEHTLQMRATDGRKKVAIVADADRLQPQAANAFLKTLEEPPNDSLLLLLSTLPEALLDTIRSRCVPIPLRANEAIAPSAEELELVALLNEIGSARVAGVQSAYRLAQSFQRLLAKVREEIQMENADARKEEEQRYRNRTDGAWLEEREDYFKALNESMYLQRRAELVEVVFRWWSDVLRASTGVNGYELPSATEATRAMAGKLTTAECLQRIRRIEELRDQLGRNIQEALAVEVAFLSVFR
jgi:DNA polymerase-3 subunit delta'